MSIILYKAGKAAGRAAGRAGAYVGEGSVKAGKFVGEAVSKGGKVGFQVLGEGLKATGKAATYVKENVKDRFKKAAAQRKKVAAAQRIQSLTKSRQKSSGMEMQPMGETKKTNQQQKEAKG